MTTTELYDRITKRLDELEAMERAATKGPFTAHENVFAFGELKGMFIRSARAEVASASARSLGSQTECAANANLFATARNLLPGMLAYFRRASKKAHAEYMACEHLYKSATGMEFVRLTDRAEEALQGLHSIARALGIEVEP